MPRKNIRNVAKKEKGTVVLKRIDPLSAAKVEAVILAIFGFIVGIGMTAFSSMMGFPYGAISIVILPIMYGVVGFVVGAIGAVVYNAIAGWIGGIKLDFE
ncbi:MAG TPA: hypothetical protein VJI12_01590 [archaeon]|nr:hypothetical protein [archaeon]